MFVQLLKPTDAPKKIEPSLEPRPILRDPLLSPLLRLRIEVVLPPELLHQSLPLHSELLRIAIGELVESEGPALKT